jgi:alkylation response protein AidB-like acyl-CoA dehydrogenase
MSFSTSDRPDTTPIADQMLAACRDLVRDEVAPQVEEWDRTDVLPQALLDRIGEIGVPGALVPAQYGGPGLPVAALVPVWRTLAQGWISLTGAVNTTHLGTALLLRYGTEAQRERWLPGIATGEIWSAFSITEPQAGSDLRRLEVSVEPTDDGLIVDGQKRWIAGGRSFPLTFMLAREKGAERQSCVVLPSEGRGTESWSVEMLDKLGYRGVESAAWRFDQHDAPGAEILGGDQGHGMGARQMIDVLAIGRVNVACRALGIIDRALELAVEESIGREIARGVLADYTHAQLRIGDMRSRQRMIEAIVEKAAASIDAGEPDAGELATAAKLNASDTAIWAVDTASRLAASRSYTWDAELSRLRRDAPQTQIGEGANDSLLLATGKAFIRARSDV